MEGREKIKDGKINVFQKIYDLEILYIQDIKRK